MNSKGMCLLGIVVIVVSVGWGQVTNDWKAKQHECIDLLSGFPKDASHQSEPQYPADLNGVTLEYFASGCYGRCPAFTLTIRKDTAEFVGHAWVRKKGKHTAKISQQQFEKFLHAWFDGKFFAMRDNYCDVKCPDGTVVIVTDIPESSITVNAGTYRKTVYECFTTIDGKPETPKPPDNYFELSREFLQFAKAQRWL